MPLSPSDSNAFTIAAYMRVTSIAIAAYDYLETQPTAWRFYREHWQSRRLTISVVLFFLLRFLSISTLTISNVGFFFGGFTHKTCGHFYLIPPAFKVIQAMVTQAILGIRAFNLSRRSKFIGWVILGVYCVACTLQWITTLYQRTPFVGDHVSIKLNEPLVAIETVLDTASFSKMNQGKVLGAYIFYAIAMIYDVFTTSISIIYLLKYKLISTNSVMAKLSKMMLYDGLGYLFVLTGINIFNLILFKTSQDIQTAAASLGYCVSWIMSQRLLIHLYDASRERREESLDGAEITISKHIGTARDISRVVRTRLDQKNNSQFDLSRRPPTIYSETEEGGYPDDIGVEVRIERTVRLSNFTRTYELEDYSRRSQHH